MRKMYFNSYYGVGRLFIIVVVVVSVELRLVCRNGLIGGIGIKFRDMNRGFAGTINPGIPPRFGHGTYSPLTRMALFVAS